MYYYYYYYYLAQSAAAKSRGDFSSQHKQKMLRSRIRQPFNCYHCFSFGVPCVLYNCCLYPDLLYFDCGPFNDPQFPIKKSDLKKLFSFATAKTHFLFNGKFYDQVDGVVMGSPLAPILANLFLGFHEETWLNNFNHSHHPLLYRCYVDDTFCVFHNEQDAIP